MVRDTMNKFKKKRRVISIGRKKKVRERRTERASCKSVHDGAHQKHLLCRLIVK